MSNLQFTKMEGLGNDFVVVDDFIRPVPNTFKPEQTRAICDRRFGVGADQILWLRKPQADGLDVRMEIINADGGFAEMCGNGIRAVGVYLEKYSKKKKEYRIETLAGIKTVTVDRPNLVSVDMGAPQFLPGFSEAGERLEWRNQSFRYFPVGMGNPHAVFFVDEVDAFPVAEMGSWVETLPRFPQRTNVEFVEVLDSRKIKVRVWERGTGLTLACGTGACAAAVASLTLRKVEGDGDRGIEVQLPGGHLMISWSGQLERVGPGLTDVPSAPGESTVIMQGPAREVFSGEFYYP